MGRPSGAGGDEPTVVYSLTLAASATAKGVTGRSRFPIDSINAREVRHDPAERIAHRQVHSGKGPRFSHRHPGAGAPAADAAAPRRGRGPQHGLLHLRLPWQPAWRLRPAVDLGV